MLLTTILLKQAAKLPCSSLSMTSPKRDLISLSITLSKAFEKVRSMYQRVPQGLLLYLS
jgi:hypothetical protein